jgi:hypothetical protein
MEPTTIQRLKPNEMLFLDFSAGAKGGAPYTRIEVQPEAVLRPRTALIPFAEADRLIA